MSWFNTWFYPVKHQFVIRPSKKVEGNQRLFKAPDVPCEKGRFCFSVFISAFPAPQQSPVCDPFCGP